MLAAGILVGMTLAACGSSSTQSAGAPGLTKAAYIAQADALCRASFREIGLSPAFKVTLSANGRSSTDNASIKREVAVQLRRDKAVLKKLRGLPEPHADRTMLSAIWRARAASLNAAPVMTLLDVKRPTAIGAARIYKRLIATIDAASRYERLTKRFGFKVCGTSAPFLDAVRNLQRPRRVL